MIKMMFFTNNKLKILEAARQNRKKFVPLLINENIWVNCNNLKIFYLLKNILSDMLIRFNNISKKTLGNYKTFYFNFVKKVIKLEQKINKLQLNKKINVQNLKIYKDFVIKNIKNYNVIYNKIVPQNQEKSNKINKNLYKNFYIELKNDFILLHDNDKK